MQLLIIIFHPKWYPTTQYKVIALIVCSAVVGCMTTKKLALLGLGCNPKAWRRTVLVHQRQRGRSLVQLTDSICFSTRQKPNWAASTRCPAEWSLSTCTSTEQLETSEMDGLYTTEETLSNTRFELVTTWVVGLDPCSSSRSSLVLWRRAAVQKSSDADVHQHPEINNYLAGKVLNIS